MADLAIDPERAQDIDYSAPSVELEGTYLVPAGSKMQNVEDADRAGVRIAVNLKSAYDLFLSRNLNHAQIVHPGKTAEAIELLAARKLGAVAGVRTALVATSYTLPGSRVMKGRFMTIPQAAGLAKGRPVAPRSCESLSKASRRPALLRPHWSAMGLLRTIRLFPPAKGK